MDLVAQDETQIESWELMLLKAASNISLSIPQYEKITKRYEHLQKILDAATEPLLQGAHIFVQGSIELKTTVKPAPEAKNDMATIDADAIVWLPNAIGASATEVLKVIQQRFVEGSRVETPIQQLRRGIRIVYADENPGFHIDVTPARCVTDNKSIKGHGCLEVPDRETGWKCSSPRDYSKWLKVIADMQIQIQLTERLAKNVVIMDSVTQDPIPLYDEYIEHNPLRATIKLLKRHRDEWAILNKKEAVRPISAIITTLAAHAYQQVVIESNHRSLRPIEAIIKIIEYMPQFIKHYQGEYAVLNPKDAGENFAEKWNRPNGDGLKYRLAFNAWHTDILDSVMLGLNDFGSKILFEQAVSERFGITKSFINEVTRQLPRNWTLPGRSAGITLNSLSLSALSGVSIETHATQDDIQPVGRLG